MNRRAAIALLGTAALAPAAFAQVRARTVGYLSNGADPAWLLRALAAHGYVEGRNLRVVVRDASAGGHLEELARELVALPADVLVSFGGANTSALAGATRAIPIVCGGTADPVRTGYARSLRRPGGNITGLSYGVPEFADISVGLMRAILPGLKRIVAVVKSGGRGADTSGWGDFIGAFESAARAGGQDWEIVAKGTGAELEKLVAGVDRRITFIKFVRQPDDVTYGSVAAMLLRHRVASFSAGPELVRHGGLLHYSLAHSDSHRRIAAIVDQLLRGANVAEVPFELPDLTTCLVNRATARSIGVTLPPEVLARATEIVG